MSRAKKIVEKMLGESYDEHVKAHELVQKWDRAHDSFGKLYNLKHKSLGLMKELGKSIAYERALARVGLKRADVAHPISGAQIGSTHNYKKGRTVRRCQNVHCRDRGSKPEDQEQCLTCGEPLVTKQVPYSFTDLHDKFGRYILGVETNDGRRVWFDEMIPPQPPLEAEEMPRANKPIPAEEFGAQGRLGKWW